MKKNNNNAYKSFDSSDFCEKCSDKFQELTKRINLLLRDNQTLTYMLEFKDSALKNREEIISKMVHQNQALLELNHSLKETNYRPSSPSILKRKTLKNQSFGNQNESKSSVKIMESPSTRIMPSIKYKRSCSSDVKPRNGSIYNKNDSQTIRKITQFSGLIINKLYTYINIILYRSNHCD